MSEKSAARKKSKKLFILDGLGPKAVDGVTAVPTKVYYCDGECFIGRKIPDAIGVINEGFKVDLGAVAPGGSPDRRETFFCEDGARRTAYELTNDFLESLLTHPCIEISREQKPKQIAMIAEPISFGQDAGSERWLSNYRGNLRRILSPRFESVEFLPEPFAVYQYYRYGMRLPSLQSSAKRIALIVDIGGGTSDFSIVETTNQGEVSGAGKHARPLGASSIPVAGRRFDEALAEFIIMRALESKKDKTDANSVLANRRDIRSGKTSLDIFAERKREFWVNFERLCRRIESSKIRLCNAIEFWGVDEEDPATTHVELPIDPFDSSSAWQRRVKLTAQDLKDVFNRKIWRELGLERTLKECLRAAHDQIRSGIDVVLLSGGGANLGLLPKLIEQIDEAVFEEAVVEDLSHDFQDVVATGLAIQAARRFWSEETEFVSVLYNALDLALARDGCEPEQVRFEPGENNALEDEGVLGNLIASAQPLSKIIDRELYWKFRLSETPKPRLSYFFTKSNQVVRGSGEHAWAGIYNHETVLAVPARTRFDRKIGLSLRISEDGTVAGRFIYKHPNERGGVKEESQSFPKFVVDSTTSAKRIGGATYVGVDFGTTNSAICMASSEHIRWVRDASGSGAYEDLSDLPGNLPAPVGIELAAFLRSSNKIDQCRLALTFVEAGIQFVCFAVIAELLRHGEGAGFMSDFCKKRRSYGPLIAILEQLATKTKHLKLTRPLLAEVLEVKAGLRDFGRELSDVKHDKHMSEKVEAAAGVEKLASAIHRGLRHVSFGYVQDSTKLLGKSGERGRFVELRGSPPYLRSRSFILSEGLSDAEPALVDAREGKVISLAPLYLQRQELGSERIYALDSVVDGGSRYKKIGEAESIEGSQFSGVDEWIAQMLAGDFDSFRFLDYEMVGSS